MRDISKIRAVIFDVDGTLYDQGVLRRKIAMRLLSTYAIRPARGIQALRVIQAYRRAHEALRGRAFSAAIQLEAASLDSGFTVAEVRILIQEWLEQAPLPFLAHCVYPGATDLLETLVGSGIKCGIFSDYPAERKLEAMGLRRFFDPVICAEDVGWLKPDPRGILHVMEEMGFLPDQAVYVGDRNIDQQAATRAGMEIALIRNGTTYANLTRRFSISNHRGRTV